MPIEIGISTTVGGIAGNTPGGTPAFSNVNSFSFDGVDEYFIGTSTYSELDGQNKATISLWAKFDNLNSARILTSLTRNSNVNDFVFMLCNVGNSLRFFTSSTTQYTYSNAVLTSNTWLHIMIAIDKTQGISTTRCKIFINGQDETSAIVNQDGTALQTSNSSLYIGENQNGKYNPMLGKIDEVAIWSGTDLRNDVATIYNNGEPTDLNNNGLTAPTTWQRMGEDATWNGATWTMTDVNGGYTNRSINMVEANRTTDVPTASSFTNTKSILLDGVDDYVETNFNADNFSLLSVSGWIKATNPQLDYNVIISNHYRNDTAPYFQFVCRIDNNGKLQYRIGNSSSSIFNVISTTTIRDNSWHHFVGTYNGSTLKIYIDGVLENTASANGNLYTTGNKTSIGGVIDVTSGSEIINNNFLGNIDELSIYNVALTQSDVTTIWNNGVPSDISSINGLTNWWRCGDGDTAPTLTDNIGSNNGTMQNFTTFSTDVPT